MEDHLSRCQYVILPNPAPFDFKARDLTNKAYDFWKRYWQRIFRAKAPDFWDPLDYFRQSLVYCLYYDDVLVAQNMSTFVHAEDLVTFDLPYFESYLGQPAEILKAEGAKTMMTLEYTAVHPGYGERRVGIRFAEVMNALAIKVFEQLGLDAKTGTPRRLSGLSDVAVNHGYRKLGENIKKAGWELDVFLGFKGELNEHPDPEYRAIIRTLWNRRVDYASHVRSKRVDTVGYHSAIQTKLEERSMKSEDIRAVYDESMAMLADKFASLDWTDKATYSLWLGQAYYLVRHTTRLLALCAGYCPFEHEDTHKRVLAHLKEEDGHDTIAVVDLRQLGYDVSAIPELKKTSELTALQYKQMADHSGIVFFGYILLLEGLAVTWGSKLHDIVSQKFGPRVTRFLKTHAEDDIEHIDQAFKQIETFSADDQKMVVENLVQSTKLYLAMLDDVRAAIDSHIFIPMPAGVSEPQASQERALS